MPENTIGGSWGAKLRLKTMIVTGMIMFVFIAMHLINLALGLISVQAMEDWRPVLSGVWSAFWPLKWLLQASLALHFLAALLSLYARNTLRVPAYDMVQMLAGILIIPLLGLHVFGVMALRDLGLEPTYMIVLSQFWIVSPLAGLQQVAMLVVAWIHGAIGVFTWLQARDASARIIRYFYPLMVALPILAMLGYVEGGRQILPVAEGGYGIVVENDPNVDGPTVDPDLIPVIIAQAKDRPKLATRISLGLVAAVLLARWLRLRAQRQGRVQVTYTGRRHAAFNASTGLTLLEMVHENNLPHANICRGRGRCGTCRVRILSGAAALPPPTEEEAKVLARWHAGPDERLACQLTPPEGKLVVERVIKADFSNLDQAGVAPQDDAPAGVG